MNVDVVIWPQQRMPRTATFISDLLLFSSRSDVDRHRALIQQSIASSEMCVWGGDLFDFRWTRLGCEQKTLTSAVQWLEDWLQRFPSIPFIFLRGNHDAHAGLSDAIDSLGDRWENFTGGVDALRVADTLMLHGDLIEGAGTSASMQVYRDSWKSKPIAHPFQSRMYDAAIAARVHLGVASAAHRRRSTCLRLWHSIQTELGDDASGLRRVVFGHTHRQIEGFRLRNSKRRFTRSKTVDESIAFYNGGAAIRHVKFKPISLDFADH